jgi:flagellar basal body-associated protein FliL
MNKALIIILILVLIGAGIFYYFFYLRPDSQTGISNQSQQIVKIDTSFDTSFLSKLDTFVLYGNIPVTVNPASLRGSNPAKANDPFFN